MAKYSDKVPLYQGFANEGKVTGEFPVSFDKKKNWLDVLKGVGAVTDEEYEKMLKEIKEKYGIED